MKREAALRLLTVYPAQVGRWCGFSRLTDGLHNLWIREMISGTGDMTLLAHRGSYKTTCLALALAILCVIRPQESLLLMRKTDEDAAEILRQVRQILQSGAMEQLTAEIYGSPVRIARAVTNELTCDCYAAPRGCAQLTGSGIGATLTGRHAERIFTDDIVTQHDRVSPAERERTRGVWQELQNVRNPGGRIVNIGTPWHPEDAVSLMPGAQRWDWRSTGLVTEDRAEELKRQMPASLFAANYELRHLPGEHALFPMVNRYVRGPELMADGIAHVDAAYGGGDATVLTCGTVHEGRILLYGRLWKRHVKDCMEDIRRECLRLRCAPLYVETNGDKGYLAAEFRRMGLCVRPYRESMNKYVKISGVLGRRWPEIDLLQGTDGAWVNQVLDYSEYAAHDDAPDSAASLVRVLERRMAEGLAG